MPATTPTQKSESNNPSTVTDTRVVEPRTRRACEQAMIVTPYAGSSMFDVYSEDGGEYTVSPCEPLGCISPNFEHRKPEGGCKHVCRVRLEFGIKDLPTSIRSKHAAPTDVELARRRQGIDVEVEPETETTPKTVEVDSAPRIVADGDRETDHKRMVANELACRLAEIDGVEGFDRILYNSRGDPTVNHARVGL